MAGVSPYEISGDDVGIVKIIILQLIREVAKQPNGKILKEKIKINQGTRKIQSMLHELSDLLQPSEWDNKENILDLALCLQMKLLELRKAKPETFSWIPFTLETDQLPGFLQVLGSKLCSKASVSDQQSTPFKLRRLHHQIYSPNDNHLNQTSGVSSTNVTNANTALCVTTANVLDDNFTSKQTFTGTNSIQVTGVSENLVHSSLATISPPCFQHGTLQKYYPAPAKNERTNSILPTGTSQRVSGINETETNVTNCTTSGTTRDVLVGQETLNGSTNTRLETSVSDNVADSILTNSGPPGCHTETFQYSGAALTENVKSSAASFLPVSAPVSDMLNTGVSVVNIEDHGLPQQDTDMSNSVCLNSTKPPTDTQAGSTFKTVFVTLAQPTVIDNMTNYETQTALGAHSSNFTLHLASVNPGPSLMSNVTTESTRGGSLMQTSSELQSADALLSLASGNVNSNTDMDNLPARGFIPTAPGDSSVRFQELIHPNGDNKMLKSATGLTEDTSGHIVNSSQGLLTVSTSECDVTTPKRMPANGEELKQSITCRSKANPRKRCQFCEDLEDADRKLYAEIRSMSKRKKEMTIKKYIKSSPPKCKGKGKRHVSNEYHLPYRHGDMYRVCRETFVKYFNTCRNTIGKIVAQNEHGEDDTDTDSDFDGDVGYATENKKLDNESVIQEDLKNHFKEFLSDQLTFTPFNSNILKTEYKIMTDYNMVKLLHKYNGGGWKKIKTETEEELFNEVMESVNIKVYSIIDERLYWNHTGECRICDLLKNNAAGESSQQQLKQHQEDADRMNRYCDRVMTTREEQGVLHVYIDIKDPNSLGGGVYLPLLCVILIDLKSKKGSYFMLEYVRTGFGVQHLLSCLKCYLERRLAESSVRRIVLITRPYGGLLRNTDLIGFFLWVMARYGVTHVQVVYEYYGHNIFVIKCQAIGDVSCKYAFSDPMIPLQQLLTDQEHYTITCMTSSDMLNFINTKSQVSARNLETIQVSLNTTRLLHLTRHELSCNVIMNAYFSASADDSGMNHVTALLRVPLPPAETELTPLYPSGYELPAEWYRWVREDGWNNWKEYVMTHVQVDESDTRKVLPHPCVILKETDGLEEK